MLGLLLVNPACFDFSSNCKSYAMDVVMRVDWGPVFCKPYTRYLGWLCLVWTCGVNRGFCKWLYQRSTWVFLWWTGELSATRYCCGITLFVVRFHQKYTYIWNRGFCLQGTFVLYRCCVPVYFLCWCSIIVFYVGIRFHKLCRITGLLSTQVQCRPEINGHSGGCLNIKMLSYQYKDPHVKD